MADYSADHASALADITEAGASVTFTPLSGSAVTGAAVQAEASPKEYEALGLVMSTSVALLFAPSTYGSEPALSSTFTWGGGAFVVAHTDPIAPSGSALVVRVWGSR